VCVSILAAGAAGAQAVKQGTLSGTVFSASGSSPSAGVDGTIMTAPASGGTFVLTQICTVGTPGANNERNAQVVGAALGRIAQHYGDDTLGSCTTYTPGIAISPGEELRCVQTGASASPVSCTVTGVLSKK
jgi:hypothetical protein